MADGTVYRADFTGTDWILSDIGIPGTAYARRLKTVRTESGDQLLAVYEGTVDAEGKTVTPVRLYRYSQKSGVPTWDAVLELPGHRECKTLTSLHTGDDVLQIGCDGSVLYEVKADGGRYAVSRTLEFAKDEAGSQKRNDESRLMPWETRSIHAVEGKDWNGDAFDELVVGVNNDGLYYVDLKSTKPPKHIRFDVSDAVGEGSKKPTFLIMDAVS